MGVAVVAAAEAVVEAVVEEGVAEETDVHFLNVIFQTCKLLYL